ncbi:hypothetical protein [Nocardia sp. NPDC052316]|uniref:hypothetical protein n=1 Tax=Nocardia sp. NPDC052316 TaxID=3364329 RepID=UPI0037C85AEE
MRLDRARVTPLLAALALTAAGWMVAAPTASADFQKDVETCLTESADYKAFKDCYKKAQKDGIAAPVGDPAEAKTQEECEANPEFMWDAEEEVCMHAD